MLPIKYILTENFNLFVPKKCEPLSAAAMLPTAITAGAGLLGDIGSTLFGQSAQREENQKNRDFALKMWQMNNEYNTPANQRKRLEEAGYSPWADQSSPNGQSVQAATPSTSSLPAFNKPFSGAAELLQHGLQVQSNLELQHAESMDKIYSILFKAYNEGGQKLYDSTLKELAPTLERFQWAGSYRQQKLDLEIQSDIHQNNLMSLDETFKDLENRWYGVIKNDEHRINQDLHRQYVQALEKIKAEIKNINAMTDKTIAEKEKILAEKVGVLIENGIKGIDFQNAQDLQETVQETALENLWKLEDERSYRPFDKDYQYQGKAGQYFPLPSGEFGAAQNLEENKRRENYKKSLRMKRANRK